MAISIQNLLGLVKSVQKAHGRYSKWESSDYLMNYFCGSNHIFHVYFFKGDLSYSLCSWFEGWDIKLGFSFLKFKLGKFWCLPLWDRCSFRLKSYFGSKFIFDTSSAVLHFCANIRFVCPVSCYFIFLFFSSQYYRKHV